MRPPKPIVKVFTGAADVRAIAARLGIPHAHAVPVSALVGDNVVDRSPNTPWYDGPSLLELLETLPPDTDPDQATKIAAAIKKNEAIRRSPRGCCGVMFTP